MTEVSAILNSLVDLLSRLLLIAIDIHTWTTAVRRAIKINRVSNAMRKHRIAYERNRKNFFVLTIFSFDDRYRYRVSISCHGKRVPLVCFRQLRGSTFEHEISFTNIACRQSPATRKTCFQPKMTNMIHSES